MEIPTNKFDFAKLEQRVLLYMLSEGENARSGYKSNIQKDVETITGRKPHPPEIQWI